MTGPDPLGAVEGALDDAGFDTAHLAGNSLGGHVALRLAERGRARSVVALAPAGGWPRADPFAGELFRLQRSVIAGAKAALPYLDTILATPEGRRRATALITTNYEHIPTDLLAALTQATAATDPASLDAAQDLDWDLDAERITCPVRIVWGTSDKLLPWPAAAVRYRTEWLPHADWVELDGVGHAPQLNVMLETAELIRGFTPA